MSTKGKQPAGVDTYQADHSALESYRRAESDLARMRTPVLLHSDNPHERLYVAALDGTGNSMFDDKPHNWSAVARIYDQIERSNPSNIATGYVEGTFTQNGILSTPERLWDGRFGHTFEDRVETAYYQLCMQAKKWIDEDSQAQIRIVGVGFSRGGEEVAALERMIEERGIRDPAGAKVIKDHENLIISIQYADKPLLVAPGKTLQAALLFDPVATGVEEHDRRLPASTMSTFQITAANERRNLFKADDHIPPGFSEDGRNYNAGVAGAHSDIGNTYERNGLGLLSQNLGVSFLNRLSDHDFLPKQRIPDDPAQYVVHRSDQGMYGLYGTSGYDQDGLRDHVDNLAPASLCRTGAVRDCTRKDPISPELEEQLERRTVPAPEIPGPFIDAPKFELQQRPRGKSGLDDSIDRLYAAILTGDEATWTRESQATTQQYLDSAHGQSWQQEVRGYEQAQFQEQQFAFEAQQIAARQLLAQQPQEAAIHNPHVMRM